MASWIVHLRIAEELLDRIPGLDPEKFALGSVGPDSGKPDEKWENFTPSTRITHFQAEDSLHHDCADLEFFRRYLLPLRDGAEAQYIPFRLGYFFHLVTDNLWGEKIGRPTQQRWSAEFAADRDFIWEVKKDWYGLDFIYVRDHPDCLYRRVFLGALPDCAGLEFLVPESLAWSVDHIQRYYQETGERVQQACQRPFIYLSRAEADRFVDESSARLFRIYQHLWINGASTGTLATALDLNIGTKGDD
ncbi:MAG TPA: hypothetical protein VMC09_08160 [Anaerolineales bacterium]|nr:hypothetical protein [Anaerolineales bacterium]